jgi:hypothetical protein
MNIDKEQTLQILRSQGQHDRAGILGTRSWRPAAG